MTRLLAPLALASCALAGCASTNHVLASEPDEVFHSPRSRDEVAGCFAKLNNTRLIEMPDGARVARFRNSYGGVTKTFSVYPEGSGSRIEARHNFIVVVGIKWRRCVGLQPASAGDQSHG